jgi:hypothetical protein
MSGFPTDACLKDGRLIYVDIGEKKPVCFVAQKLNVFRDQMNASSALFKKIGAQDIT